MKIKMDFVSNSSSTSFVYIAKDVLSKADFFEAVGVSPSAPVAALFEKMYGHLKSSIESGRTMRSANDIDDLDKVHDFTPAVLDRMKSAIDQGLTVTTGEFSSETDLAESILCLEIFEIESERFYINAYDSYW